MPKGGQAEWTMLGVSEVGAGLTKENFMLGQAPQCLIGLGKISFAKTTEVLFRCLVSFTQRNKCRLGLSASMV